MAEDAAGNKKARKGVGLSPRLQNTTWHLQFPQKMWWIRPGDSGYVGYFLIPGGFTTWRRVSEGQKHQIFGLFPGIHLRKNADPRTERATNTPKNWMLTTPKFYLGVVGFLCTNTQRNNIRGKETCRLTQNKHEN